MLKRMKLKIGTKLAVALGLMLLLFIIAIGLSIGVDRNTATIIDDFFEKQFYTALYTQEIGSGVERVGHSLAGAVSTSSAENRAAYIEEAGRFSKENSEVYSKLQDVYDGSPELLKQFDGLFGDLGFYHVSIVELLEANSIESAAYMYAERFLPATRMLRDCVSAISGELEIAMEDSLNKVNQNSQILTIGALFLTVIIGSASLVMSVLIIRSVTWPVAELKMASEELAKGNLQVELECDTSDELGDLASSIRQTVDSLSGYISEIDKALVALGEGDLGYEAPDVFMGDFVAIRESIQKIAILLGEQKERDEQSRRELERAYDEANKANKAKSDFLSRMSHDMRTPLNAIIGMSSIALTNTADTEKVEDCLKRALSSSQHLLGLINDILDMSKIESGNMTLNSNDTSLVSVVESMITIVQPQIRQRRQRFHVRAIDVRHENVICDALRLSQVLINILSNAVKFTPDEGRIDFDIAELPSEREGYGRYTFRFVDTGIGMRKEFVNDIFSAFSRERDSMVDKIEGSGLGMAISKRIVDMMEGSISVESEEGVGSVFTVDLLLRLSENVSAQPDLSGVRVLLVDRDIESRRAATGILTGMGAVSDWCADGEDAGEKVRLAKESGEGYDAVIVDCSIHDLAGFDAAAAILGATGAEIPVIATSSYDINDVKDAAKELAFTAFVSKPLFGSTMYGAVRHLSGSGKGSDEIRTAYDFSGRRVLLVEDNEINQLIALEILSNTGADVDVAANGLEALNLFMESENDTYDIVLMDVQMPVMGGYEATRKIRELDRPDAATVPIFALTANAFAEDIEAAIEAGMNYHLAKPLDIGHMLGKIGEYLRVR